MAGVAPTARDGEHDLLVAARCGDADSYGALVAPYRPALLAHCYRMLGSFHDAEDALQDVLLQAWRGLPRFEGRSSFRSWMYTIATNACLKAIDRRDRRILPADHGPPTTEHERPDAPLVESIWIEPFPDDALAADVSPAARYELRESIELAFIAALQHLPPRQRAVLILREVLGFSGSEVATALGSTPAAVYSALQRAHKAVDARRGEPSQQATARALGDANLGRLAKRYVEAWERNDVDSIRSMLTADATIAMPPRSTWYRGRDAVAAFLAEWPLSPGTRWRLGRVGANGQLAFASSLWRPEAACFEPHAIDVLELRGDRIAAITAFMGADVVRAFRMVQPPGGH
jgi:RNA polymerase sigma-70 factor (ECF subfamily)